MGGRRRQRRPDPRRGRRRARTFLPARLYGQTYSTRLIKQDTFRVDAAGKGVGLTFTLGEFLTGQITWDYYRINTIVVTFLPQINPTMPIDQGTGGGGFNETSVDFDDATPPTSKISMENWNNTKFWRNDRKFTIKFRPVFHRLVATSATSTTPVSAEFNQRRNRGVWLNSAYKDIPHFGLKTFFVNNFTNPAQNTIIYQILIKAYVSFKRPIWVGTTTENQ
ncbi:capsid protein [Human stool-associated circular virus NG13]|uniref:Capsid protein n=1 Tax=Human stool-associated circular virus NG13 TaxID=743300 RepID=D4N3R1_9CIRC|nr:capsid protein [Human stool-associated circular virus NG13]ADD62476.1 capsid protein [Human stool-associated circular virus NG13]